MGYDGSTNEIFLVDGQWLPPLTFSYSLTVSNVGLDKFEKFEQFEMALDLATPGTRFSNFSNFSNFQLEKT